MTRPRGLLPPRLKDDEVAILTPEQITAVRRALEFSALGPIVNLGLATGAAWANSWRDLDGATLTVQRSLEQTKGGLRFKSPKTKHGRRKIALPPSAVLDLDQHRRRH
jgi:hypothetical protein